MFEKKNYVNQSSWSYQIYLYISDSPFCLLRIYFLAQKSMCDWCELLLYHSDVIDESVSLFLSLSLSTKVPGRNRLFSRNREPGAETIPLRGAKIQPGRKIWFRRSRDLRGTLYIGPERGSLPLARYSSWIYPHPAVEKANAEKERRGTDSFTPALLVIPPRLCNKAAIIKRSM